MTSAREPSPKGEQRVWLIGSMGAGKTAVGVALSALLGWRLLDNDRELARRTGHEVTELADAGWDALHGEESAQLRAAAKLMPPFVAGVAASVGDRPNDLDLLRRTGTVVYLRARPETLANRVGHGEDRPWLDAEPLPWLAAMLARREPGYLAAADLVIDVDTLTPAQVAERVAQGMSQR